METKAEAHRETQHDANVALLQLMQRVICIVHITVIVLITFWIREYIFTPMQNKVLCHE